VTDPIIPPTRCPVAELLPGASGTLTSLRCHSIRKAMELLPGPFLTKFFVSLHHFTTKTEARTVALACVPRVRQQARRHSPAAMMAPIDHEHTAAQPANGQEAA
jgi:hypothetical protein